MRRALTKLLLTAALLLPTAVMAQTFPESIEWTWKGYPR